MALVSCGIGLQRFDMMPVVVPDRRNNHFINWIEVLKKSPVFT